MNAKSSVDPNLAVANPYLAWLKEQKANDLEKDFQQQLADYQASYFAGEVSRFLPSPPGLKGLGGSGWNVPDAAYFLMIARARHEDEHNMVFGQGVNRLVSNVIPSAFSHDAQTGDEALDDDLHEGWLEYTADKRQCDFEEERDFESKVEMSFRNMVIDGDLCHLILDNGQIQTMEGHKNRSPWSTMNRRGAGPDSGIVHGVELKDGKRVRVAGWIRQRLIVAMHQSHGIGVINAIATAMRIFR